MPSVCSDPQIVSLFEGFFGTSSLLSAWDMVNLPGDVVAMGNAYRSWLIANAYVPFGSTCFTLTDVQNLANLQPTGRLSAYLATATTYHNSLTNTIGTMSQSDIIQTLNGGVNIPTIINTVFTQTTIYTALRDNGLATFWGYIIAQVSPSSNILDYYKTNYEEDFVKQCIIAIPLYINSYITNTVSNYLHQIQANYTSGQYATLMNALAYKYYIPTQTLELAEWHIYGSSRVGIYRADKPLAVIDQGVYTSYTYQTRVKFRYNGKKSFELSNHLGNVLVTISDRREAVCSAGDTTLGYKSVVVTANDYFAFGSIMEGRSYEGDTNLRYRFGFNTQEKDDEVYGEGNANTAEFWEYDARLGRRWNVDQISTHTQSGYVTFSNNPICRIDPNGNSDYYTASGRYLGSDGSEGTEIIIVTKKRIIRKIDQVTKQVIDKQILDNVSPYTVYSKSLPENSFFVLPSYQERQEIKEIMENQSEDAANEVGGIGYELSVYNRETHENEKMNIMQKSMDGKVSENPSDVENINLDRPDPSYKTFKSYDNADSKTLKYTWHSHPFRIFINKGTKNKPEWKLMDEMNKTQGGTSIGEQTQTTGGGPSSTDRTNASKRGSLNNYIISKSDHAVFRYNGDAQNDEKMSENFFYDTKAKTKPIDE